MTAPAASPSSAERPAGSSRLSPRPLDHRGSWATGGRFVGLTLLVYALARGVSALLLNVLTRYQVPVGWTGPRVDYFTIVGLWDAGWYREIAEHGYPATLPVDAAGQLQQSPWAFYPLFPFVTKAVMTVSGWPFAAAGSTVALLLGGAAAVVIALQLRERVGARAGVAAVVVWSTCGPSPVLQVAYSESLAILLLALVLWALQKENWWAAAGLALFTGLARPIAVPLAVVALVAVAVRLRERASRPVTRAEGGGMLASLAACGLAGLTWPVVAWLGTGVPSAYTDTMATWRAGQHIQSLTPWVGVARYVFGSAGGSVALVVIIVLLVGVVTGPWASPLGPVLRAWCLAYPAYLAFVLDPGTSVFRYLVPLYPWAVIAVDGAWRSRREVSPSRERAVLAPATTRPSLVDAHTLPPHEQGRTTSPAGGADVAPAPRRVWGLTAVWVALGTATQWWWLYELWRFVPPSDFPP